LRDRYKGLPPKELKNHSIAEGVSEVDFDLAFSDLTFNGLIDTGPKEHVKNNPYSEVVFVGFFTSKNEYSYLTEDGYKEAVQITTVAPSKQSPLNTHIHISESTFHNSPIGVGEHFVQTSSSSTSSLDQAFFAIRNEVPKLVSDERKREEILSRLDELEAADDNPSKFEKYTKLVATIGDHITVLGFLLPPLFEWVAK
jgi:hypothetical protein